MPHQPAYRSASYRAYLCPEVIEAVIEPESTELYITKPRKRTPPPPTEPAPRRSKKTAPDDQIRCARVRDEVKATGPNTPPAELARRLHMDVWEVRRHLRTLGYNAKPPE